MSITNCQGCFQTSQSGRTAPVAGGPAQLSMVMLAMAFLACAQLPPIPTLYTLFTVMVPSCLMPLSRICWQSAQPWTEHCLIHQHVWNSRLLSNLASFHQCWTPLAWQAALVCRHEFVAVAVNMLTAENFCYYDIMLKHMRDQYEAVPSRQLGVFFLDIACQFQAYWNR